MDAIYHNWTSDQMKLSLFSFPLFFVCLMRALHTIDRSTIIYTKMYYKLHKYAIQTNIYNINIQ